jgi:hypothetical protein
MWRLSALRIVADDHSLDKDYLLSPVFQPAGYPSGAWLRTRAEGLNPSVPGTHTCPLRVPYD